MGFHFLFHYAYILPFSLYNPNRTPQEVGDHHEKDQDNFKGRARGASVQTRFRFRVEGRSMVCP